MEEDREIVEILDDVKIPGTDIILEKGDRIEVLSDAKKAKKSEEEVVDEKKKKKKKK